jgi:hypothetical protein
LVHLLYFSPFYLSPLLKVISTGFIAGNWWLTPVILATQEAETRRMIGRSQLGQIVCEAL